MTLRDGCIRRSKRAWGNKKIKLVIQYLLTHCALIVGEDSGKLRCKTLTYFGKFSNAKIHVVNQKTLKIETCQICNEPLYEVLIGGRGNIDDITYQDVDIWGDEIRYTQIVKSYELRWKPVAQTRITEICGAEEYG